MKQNQSNYLHTVQKLHHCRKLLLACLLVCLCIVGFSGDLLAQEKLNVFYPSVISASVRQQALKSDKSTDGVHTTVFGKYREFYKANKSAPAEYVLVPSSFLKFNTQYKPVYQFTGVDSKDFEYLILSIKNNVKMENLDKFKGGLIDEVGRRNNKAYVSSLLGGKEVKVNLVAKTEDLLPYLLLGNTDFIIIRDYQYNYLKTEFKTPTVTVGKTISCAMPILCVRKDVKLNKNLNKLSAETIQKLGFGKLQLYKKENQ